MHSKINERYFFYGFLLIVVALTFLIFRPFLAVLAVGASLAVVFHPTYEWLRMRFSGKADWLAALLSTLLFIIVLFGPLALIGSLVFQQSNDLYQSINLGSDTNSVITALDTNIQSILPSGFELDLKERVGDLASFVSSNVAKIFASTLQTLFSFLLVILSLFYFLKDGARWRKSIVLLSPLNNTDDNQILAKLSRAVSGVIKGYLLIGLIQGILMGVGLAVFGVPHAALWGVLTGIASLVPSIGTALVGIPAILYLALMGDTGSAIGLGIWAAVLVGGIDNLLNPIIVGKKIDVPPLLILFSVLGGIAFMGPVGILLGPLVISLLHTLIQIYRDQFQLSQQ